MAGRPSAATIASLTEKIEALEGRLAEPTTAGLSEMDRVKALEVRMTALEAQMAQHAGFLKRMYSL